MSELLFFQIGWSVFGILAAFFGIGLLFQREVMASQRELLAAGRKVEKAWEDYATALRAVVRLQEAQIAVLKPKE